MYQHYNKVLSSKIKDSMSNKHLESIEDAIDSKNLGPYLYELYAAIKTNTIPWNLLSPDIKEEKFNIRGSQRDIGIVSYSCD